MQILTSDITKVSSAELKEWFENSSPEKQKEISAIKVEKKQIERIVSDRLKRKALADYCVIDPLGIEFASSEKGKPFAKNVDANFNVSHSGDYVVCAVSDKEIGIDIEKIRAINPHVAERFATPVEIEHINSTPNGLFEIWVLKEAYFKCTGSGLGKDVKSVQFIISGNKVECSDKNYTCSFIEIADGYVCAVCEKK